MQTVKRGNSSILSELLLGLYLFVVWGIYIYEKEFAYYAYNVDDGIWVMAAKMLMALVGALILAHFLVGVIRKLPSYADRQASTKEKLIKLLIFSAVSFAVLYLWYCAVKPGMYSLDSDVQYTQALTGEYSDWHPVWHTLLAFTLPLKLFGDVGAIVLSQVVVSALVFGWMATVIWEYSDIRLAFFALTYLLLNPFVCNITMWPWKDVAFSLAAVAIMLCTVKIYFTRGEWAKSHIRIILMAVCLASATLFRHNAILFTGSLTVALLFIMNKKRWMELLLIFAALLCVIKGPVYSALNVVEPGDRPVEVLGLPLTVIINVAINDPEALDEETTEFVESMFGDSIYSYANSYITFNDVKWDDDTDVSVANEVGTEKILKMALRCFANDSINSLNGIFHLTDIVYSVDGASVAMVKLNNDSAPAGATYQGNISILRFLLMYYNLVYCSIFKYFCYIGTAMLFMLTFMLSRSNLRRWADWKRLFLCLPVFVYNFGTMLLLSGDDYRFFYETFLLCPLVILIMLKDNRLDGAIE